MSDLYRIAIVLALGATLVCVLYLSGSFDYRVENADLVRIGFTNNPFHVTLVLQPSMRVLPNSPFLTQLGVWLLKEQEENGLRTIWGMLDHDLCHAGELALMLGVLGLETPEF